MKLNIKKSLLSAAVVSLAMGAVSTSCVGDLDVTPINPQQTLTIDTDALLNKIYASFCLTGQTGGAGNQDISSMEDEGQSEFYRMSWYINEFTTDEASWVWASDAGVPELLHNNYDASNTFSEGLYYRLTYTITLCNFFLEQVSDAQKCAEVRFIRALNYYYMMDAFGCGPFLTKVSAENAPYYNRSQIFDFVESELKAIDSDLADAGKNTYGRVDKVAAWLLLSRLYLNAEVYTGTAKYDLAKQYADKVINNGYYHLNTTGATNPVTGEQYSAYQMLFLADNDKNGAQYEAILPVLNDGLNTQSYGGMNYLVFSAYSAAMDEAVPSGTNNSWGKCARTRGKLIEKFFGNNEAPQATTVAEITQAAGDDRALFYTKGYTQYITDESNADQGFSIIKFRNVRSDGGATSSVAFVDTDLPLLRMAEAYLTYAEASTRLEGVNADATSKIDALRDRAHAQKAAGYTLDDILDEWSREFWFEGRRRIDLVRFGKYAGQSDYKWNYMGGQVSGIQFANFRSIYALPQTDLDNNSNLKQNTGY